MKTKSTLILTFVAAFLISFSVRDYAVVEEQDQGGDKQRTFVGSDKCKPCHMSPKKGAQYKSWAESRHAKAYETLASDKAKEIAGKKGIANAQEAGECVKCHIDGHGVDAAFLGEKYNKAQGVGCESCHGAGGDYWTKEVMTDITGGKVDRATVGLIKPDEAVCKKCHNEESPTFVAFNFEEMSKKIAHPMPKP